MYRAESRGVLLRCSIWTLLGTLLGVGCNPALEPERLQPPPGAPRFAATVRAPEKLTSIEATSDTLSPDPNAQNLRVACVTCHSVREIRRVPQRAADLKEFHVGLVFAHGALECASCHAEGQPPGLHLADGEPLPMSEALRLCAQCHGPQWRDFQHGAHGGMRGHWDLSRGPRERNHCVDCHDPHSPGFVGGQPVLPPRDRFLPAPETGPRDHVDAPGMSNDR